MSPSTRSKSVGLNEPKDFKRPLASGDSRLSISSSLTQPATAAAASEREKGGGPRWAHEGCVQRRACTCRVACLRRRPSEIQASKQASKQAIDQSSNRPSNPSNRSTNQVSKQSISQRVNHSVNRSTNRPSNQSASRFTRCLLLSIRKTSLTAQYWGGW
jgi:hypothetical protein